MCPDAMFSCEQVNKSAALYASVEGMSQSNAPSSRWSEWPSGFQCPWGAIGRGRRGGRVTKGPEGAKAMTGSPFGCPDHGGARDRLIGSLDFHCILLHFPFASCYRRLHSHLPPLHQQHTHTHTHIHTQTPHSFAHNNALSTPRRLLLFLRHRSNLSHLALYLRDT